MGKCFFLDYFFLSVLIVSKFVVQQCHPGCTEGLLQKFNENVSSFKTDVRSDFDASSNLKFSLRPARNFGYTISRTRTQE